MIEFDRVRQTIGSRTILVTSWFDESRQTWCANAPDYSYMADLLNQVHGTYPTRKAAIEKLSFVLAAYFASKDETKKR